MGYHKNISAQAPKKHVSCDKIKVAKGEKSENESEIKIKEKRSRRGEQQR